MPTETKSAGSILKNLLGTGTLLPKGSPNGKASASRSGLEGKSHSRADTSMTTDDLPVAKYSHRHVVSGGTSQEIKEQVWFHTWFLFCY